jgi:Ca2+-binding RTX toxin-like protein
VSASFQAVTYTGGSGVDTITVGHQAAHTLTGGGGVDHFVFNALNASALAGMTTIADYRAAGGANAGAADVIDILGIVTVASNISTVQDFSTQSSLAAALGVMANAATTSNGLSAFIYGGNEYIYVESTGAASTYSPGDTVIKLTGTPFAAGTSIVGLGIDGV